MYTSLCSLDVQPNCIQDLMSNFSYEQFSTLYIADLHLCRLDVLLYILFNYLSNICIVDMHTRLDVLLYILFNYLPNICIVDMFV